MPTYRCFCRTVDERIITGARIEASDVGGVLAAAWERWQELPGFHDVEIWQQNRRLVPAPDVSAIPVAAWPEHVPAERYAFIPPRSRDAGGVASWQELNDPAPVAAARDADGEAGPERSAGGGSYGVGLDWSSGDGSYGVGCLSQSDLPAVLQARPSDSLKPLPFQLVVSHSEDGWGMPPVSAVAVQGLAHDLAEPLTAILNYLQVSRRLADEPTPTPTHTAELAEAVTRAIEQANRARDLVRQLRSVSTAPSVAVSGLV